MHSLILLIFLFLWFLDYLLLFSWALRSNWRKSLDESFLVLLHALPLPVFRQISFHSSCLPSFKGFLREFLCFLSNKQITREEDFFSLDHASHNINRIYGEKFLWLYYILRLNIYICALKDLKTTTRSICYI